MSCLQLFKRNILAEVQRFLNCVERWDLMVDAFPFPQHFLQHLFMTFICVADVRHCLNSELERFLAVPMCMEWIERNACGAIQTRRPLTYRNPVSHMHERSIVGSEVAEDSQSVGSAKTHALQTLVPNRGLCFSRVCGHGRARGSLVQSDIRTRA